MTWPFDQQPDVAAVTCKTVMAGASVLLVSHYLDDHSWAFLDGQAWDVEEALLVSMKTVLDLHKELVEIADLPPGWTATRTSVDDPWVREPESPE
jgi:hypothetical protein